MIAPDGTQVWPTRQDGSDGRWRWGQDRVRRDAAAIDWVSGRDGWVPYYRVYAKGDTTSRPIESIWTHAEVGSNRTSKAEVKAIFGSKVFDTPKPEALLQRIIESSSDPGDLIMDSFLGSGTTAAVAHKLSRRWIGIEVLDHAHTLAAKRLRAVIDNEDRGGISGCVRWAGGGGFRFFRLAPSLLDRDKWGNWIVSNNYNPEMLAEAMCKLEGFRYEPDPEVFWIHGKSTETDFIYVTTQNLSRDQLRFISDQVGTERTLLICCGAFRAKRDEFPNLTVKKIPKAVLRRCEWGRDDYSLNVESMSPVQVAKKQRAQPDLAAVGDNGKKQVFIKRQRLKVASAR
jgi:adenine-specific DNA-methyltransferase